MSISSAFRMFGSGALLVALPLAGCVPPPPSGPTVVAMPAAGESFTKFQSDDANCRNYAQSKLGNPAGQQHAETNNAIGTAAIGTALGAGAGALLGAAGGNAGAGAAVGAGVGLLRRRFGRLEQRLGHGGRGAAAIRHRLRAMHGGERRNHSRPAGRGICGACACRLSRPLSLCLPAGLHPDLHRNPWLVSWPLLRLPGLLRPA